MDQSAAALSKFERASGSTPVSLMPFTAGVALHNLSQYKQAQKKYEAAVTINPSFVAGHFQWGRALHDLGDYRAAIKKYELVLAINPNHADAHASLGNALAMLQQKAEAIAEFKKALSLNPMHASTYSLWGNLELAQGDYNVGRSLHQRAVRLNRGPEQWMTWGSGLHEIGRYREAIDKYQTALRTYRNSPWVNNAIGTSLSALGDYEGAVRRFTMAKERNPDLGEPYVGLGNALASLQRRSDAMQQFDGVTVNLISPRIAAGCSCLPARAISRRRTKFEQALQATCVNRSLPGLGERSVSTFDRHADHRADGPSPFAPTRPGSTRGEMPCESGELRWRNRTLRDAARISPPRRPAAGQRASHTSPVR